MKYYPVYLDVKNKACLVVGGGEVGTRKVKTLLDCGARVTVVSLAVAPELFQLVRAGAVTLHRRTFRPGDLDGMFLVIGATDDPRLNLSVSREALGRNMLCNVADRPEACNFILPSIVNRGDLIIAVSTSGTSPAFAKTLRRELEQRFGPEHADFLSLMGQVRRKLLKTAHPPEAHKPLFEALIRSDLLRWIKEKDIGRINALLRKIFGKEYEIDALPGEKS
ncbi:MAG: bifunctional precorrin-2 dehydrogenase/sirohydrochlorin ferrochelatase [Deltaproteobacteria bacterium]|nr:bifunctional precorrin-2 dehydrogenase/sirohydrochlorin ferrochelatase [Deltaproteobacteria bacterium]MBW2040746.1 bifunctional precorrin-2 dehydrogenase/sirohydrochlorin ferrochelatase [Deltaproteobacteria bacterium]MBW2131150.1 bifunctional precorrin-2 dehydrogenase/sirohydrochlorin ferrochelatase [Deltaproteobacteria bacterium]